MKNSILQKHHTLGLINHEWDISVAMWNVHDYTPIGSQSEKLASVLIEIRNSWEL